MLMRKIFLLVFVAGSFSGISQIAFQQASFSEALSQAKAEGKLIFLQLESPECKQCTEVAEKGLSDKEVSKMINEAFIPLYISAKHKDRKEIENLYNSPDGFGSLFIDHNGTLIHKYSGTASMSDKYKEQIAIAFNKAGENLKVSELEKEYRNGNKSVGFIEQLLLKKNELNLSTTSLLDEYVSLLPADSLNSIYTLQFIASMAPVLGSKADSTLRSNRNLFNQAWYPMPLNKRVNINARIIHNSLIKAIREKDETYAFRIASFARGTVTTTKTAAEKAYFMRLLEFYERTENTQKYLATATHYYDNYVMTVDADSIKRADDVMRDKLAVSAKKDTVKTANGFTVRSTVRFAAVAQRYTNELKDGAWNVYKKTSDPALLAKATGWIKKGLEFHESYEALNVYAHLLYKQLQKEEAIKVEKEAIALKKKYGYSVKDNEAVLSLMEKGLPLD